MNKVYQKRRDILGKLLPKDCGIIIPGADLQYRNADSSYNFRQDSSFYYLSGFCEADSTILIKNNNGSIESSIFVPKKDKLKETWDGHIEGPEGAISNYAFDNAYVNEDIDSLMPNLIIGMDRIFYLLGNKDNFDQKVVSWIKKATSKDRHSKSIDIANGTSLIGNMRLIKDDEEIAIIKKAFKVFLEIFWHLTIYSAT